VPRGTLFQPILGNRLAAVGAAPETGEPVAVYSPRNHP
jgi:hypothetical protein